MAQCPSETWIAYEQDQESAENASDQERLAALDAYGHLTYTAGYGNEDDADGETRGDMLWCFDFRSITTLIAASSSPTTLW